MFTIPRAKRDELNANPLTHFLAGLVQAAAISTAQGVVDQHVSDPALAEVIKAQIEGQVKAHIPIPDQPAAPAPVNPLNLLVPFGGMSRPSLAPLNSPIIDPTAPSVPDHAIDPIAAGAESAGA